jgi:hypothetical protein
VVSLAAAPQLLPSNTVNKFREPMCWQGAGSSINSTAAQRLLDSGPGQWEGEERPSLLSGPSPWGVS